MEEVATGGDSGEQLPMVLKVPQMDSNPYHVCYSAYSMLGFGDLLVPGLLLSFCHSFDLFKGTPMKVYWLVANICKCPKYMTRCTECIVSPQDLQLWVI